MASPARPLPDAPHAEPPDWFFRLVAGLYAAALVVPAALTAAALRGAGAGVLYGLLLATAAAVTAVAG